MFPEEPMEFTHRLESKIAVFTLEGSLLSETDREAIKSEMTNYLDQGVHHFLVDLSNLKHVNSTGLGVFITLYTRVRSKGGELLLNQPSDNIRNLLQITKLDSVFRISSSLDEGLVTLKEQVGV
jgi:anti-anti-sigma factor